MWSLIILAVVMLIVVSILKLFFEGATSEKEEKPQYHYGRKDFLMSRAEREFFDVLIEAVGNQYHVFPQIHLDNILNYKINGRNRFGSFRHINEKSVDFVICDKAHIKPLLAVELDDGTHEREDRKERDVEVERILNGADMPFLRMRNHGQFNKDKIERLMMEKLRYREQG